MNTMLSGLVAVTLAASSGVAHAADDAWLVKVGVHEVDPKSNNGTLAGTLRADVQSQMQLTLTAEYFFTRNWGAELLASVPFEHDVKLNGAKAGTFKHLPPTASVQYHFMPDATISPFVGVGINYTWTYDEKTKGPLAGTRLALGNSWGPAVHGGVDVRVASGWVVSADVRWMSIDADAKVNGAKVGTVHVDPLVYGVAVGYRF